MTLSDWIQSIAIAISLLTSGFSIYWSFRIERRNLRPNVIVYMDYIDTVTIDKYLIIKNIGHSLAKIVEFKPSQSLNKKYFKNNMQSVIDSYVAPDQKIMSEVNPEFEDWIHIHLIFEDENSKRYERDFNLNFGMNKDVLWDTTNNPELSSSNFTLKKALITSAHAISKRLL